MSKHRQEKVRTSREVQVDRIRDRVVELTEPHVETIVQHVPDRHAGRLVQRQTRIDHPSLLGQLQVGITSSTAGGASRGPSSRPAANLEPLVVLHEISAGTSTWLRIVDPRRASRADMRAVIGRLWRLADHASTLPDEQLRNLDGDVMGWWVRARTVTTWGDPPMRPHVPCPDCSRWGRINVRLYPTTAACLECGAAWDATTIGALGEHVRLILSPAIDLDAEREVEVARSLVVVPLDLPPLPDVLRGAPLA